MLDWDPSSAFVFVDPAISRQSLVGFLAQSLQILDPLFRPRFLVIASTLSRSNNREHNHTKKRKEKHNAEPCRPWSACMGNLTK
jgi:hypothetical protein